MNPRIRFFTEEVDYIFKGKIKTRQWLKNVITEEMKITGTINIVFCNDSSLFNLNKTYLKHTTLTDIITFPFPDSRNRISGDIFISIERVRENATEFKQQFINELNRVMVHGILHLLGYQDKNKNEKLLMIAKEDYYLKKWNI